LPDNATLKRHLEDLVDREVLHGWLERLKKKDPQKYTKVLSEILEKGVAETCITDWFINVWDCHGHMFNNNWKTLPEDVVFYHIGYFSIPIFSKDWEKWERNERLREKVENWCHRVLRNRGGAINHSGYYIVFVWELEELREIVETYGNDIRLPC